MKIALLGSAPSSVRLAPTKDQSFSEYVGARPLLEQHQFPHLGEEWQIWGCSPGVYGIAERIDRWFELHRWEPGQSWFSPEYCEFLRKFKGPLYTTEVVPELPASMRLPREMIVQEFGEYFLTSSLSFMLALAIIEIDEHRSLCIEHGTAHAREDDEIGMWGVDMAATEEYGYQRAGCQFFFMEAKRRGIRIALPPESDLMRPMPMYGVSEWSHAHIKGLQRLRELQGRLSGNQNNQQMMIREEAFLRGAIENQEYNMKTWVLNQHSTLCAPDEAGRQLLYLEP